MIKMQPITEKQLVGLLAAARGKSARDHLLLLLGYSHGLRAIELTRLKNSDVNLKDGTLRITVAKRRKRTVSVETLASHSNPLLNARSAVARWLSERRDSSPYLLPSRKAGPLSRVQVYRICRHYAELAGLPDLCRGPHALRHSLGHTQRHAGTPIEVTQKVLRHASLNSTAVYYGVSQSDADQARLAAIQSVGR